MFFADTKDFGEPTGYEAYDEIKQLTEVYCCMLFFMGILYWLHDRQAKNLSTEKEPELEKPVESTGAGEGGAGTQGVGNPVAVEGRGNTGRTIPNTLNEQMAMHQVQSNPLEGATQVPLEMTDPRWPASEGWVKMQSVVQNADGTKTIIHFLYNVITGAFDDFKFK